MLKTLKRNKKQQISYSKPGFIGFKKIKGVKNQSHAFMYSFGITKKEQRLEFSPQTQKFTTFNNLLHIKFKSKVIGNKFLNPQKFIII